MSASARKRLACDECTRKKIKCDKNLPCENCTKRGLQDACARSGELDINRQPSAAPQSQVDLQQSAAPDQTALVLSLSTRLAELENAVKAIGNSSARRPAHQPLSAASGRGPSCIAPGLTELHPHGSRHNTTAADSEAASILEFLAWGRRKPDYNVAVSPEAGISQSTPNGIGDAELEHDVEHGMIEAESQISLVQMLLPSRQQIEQLVAYHEESVLWYHGSFFPPVFRKQLGEFFEKHDGNIEDQGVNLQWAALLFSILTGSMCCAPRQTIRQWGFRDTEQAMLSKQWHRAVVTCLNTGDFTARHQLVGVEAIATLTVAAHLLGHSNNQSVLLASAVRIAQSLGLHRLSSSTSGTVAERGRRVWCQLCTQDWFGIPFSESYGINPLYCSTGKPVNCDEDDMLPLPDSLPTRVGYPRFLHDIARLMPQLQDGMASSNTLYTKYEQVLKYDKQMRALATTHRPQFLSNSPIDPSWPRWVPWARRSLTIGSAHKIIMIHRQFLGSSFTSSPFSFTRRTCIAAAKTTLKEQKQTDDPDTPHLWIFDAFSVAACIILCLDLFYRDSDDPECAEHRGLVEEAVEILRNTEGSMIARRGVRLVSSLLSEESKTTACGPENTNKRKATELQPQGRAKKQRYFDVPSFVKKSCEGTRQTSTDSPGQGGAADGETALRTPSARQLQSQLIERPSEVDSSYTNRLLREADDRVRPRDSDMLSPRGNFEAVSSFENLLFLAQTYNI